MKMIDVNRTTRQTSIPVGGEAMDRHAVRRCVERARGGDEDAFGELVKMYYQRVYGLLFGIVGNVDDAKEVAQQAWVKAWSKLHTFKQDAEFFTWVYRIASNAGLDFLRHRARRREESFPEGGDGYGNAQPDLAASERSRPDREAEHAEIGRLFHEALAELTPEHRTTLTLREVDGLSYDEIARVMECRKGTVMSRLFYARRKIQERLGGLQ